jgi:hypothetical protein
MARNALNLRLGCHPKLLPPAAASIPSIMPRSFDEDFGTMFGLLRLGQPR